MIAALVPELVVTDLAASLETWCGVFGFRVVYDRPEAAFAYLARDGAAVMLEQVDPENWLAGPLERPFGRGINLEIETDGLDALASRVAAAGTALFRPMEEVWYRAGDGQVGKRQFIVLDPDGYMIRFAERIGTRGTVPVEVAE